MVFHRPVPVIHAHAPRRVPRLRDLLFLFHIYSVAQRRMRVGLHQNVSCQNITLCSFAHIVPPVGGNLLRVPVLCILFQQLAVRIVRVRQRGADIAFFHVQVYRPRVQHLLKAFQLVSYSF